MIRDNLPALPVVVPMIAAPLGVMIARPRLAWALAMAVTWAAFVLTIVSGIAGVALVYAPRSLAAEVPRSRHALFYPVFLLALTGLLGMTVTGDAFNVFVFLEISSLATYALVALGPDRRSSRPSATSSSGPSAAASSSSASASST